MVLRVLYETTYKTVTVCEIRAEDNGNTMRKRNENQDRKRKELQFTRTIQYKIDFKIIDVCFTYLLYVLSFRKRSQKPKNIKPNQTLTVSTSLRRLKIDLRLPDVCKHPKN